MREKKGTALTHCRFYDDLRHNCKALNDLYCEKEEKLCSFFKPKEEIKKEEVK
jgi:hypothetical protein